MRYRPYTYIDTYIERILIAFKFRYTYLLNVLKLITCLLKLFIELDRYVKLVPPKK